MKGQTLRATLPETEPVLPEQVPRLDTFPDGEDSSVTLCTIRSSCGQEVTVWSLPDASTFTQTGLEVRLLLSPERPVIIGRKEGGEIEYLDPKYVPTPIVPGSGKTILQEGGSDKDIYVSRGHFLMRGHAQGIFLVNGVPRRGGGIRPPRNGTYLVAPQQRPLLPGEGYMIPHGAEATIRLPNGTQLTLHAD